MGTVLVHVKRLWPSGSQGRSFLADYISASGKAHRDWVKTKAGKLSTADGHYRLCKTDPGECSVGPASESCVHFYKWRTWKEEELMAGSIDYPKEAKGHIEHFFKKMGLSKGKGDSGSLPWSTQGILKIGRPRKSPNKEGDDEEEARGSRDRPRRKKVTELEKQLQDLQAQLAEEKKRGQPAKRKAPKGDETKTPKKKPKKPGIFEGGIVPGDDEPDWGGSEPGGSDDGSDPDDDEPSDDEEDDQEEPSEEKKKVKKKKEKPPKKEKKAKKAKKKGKKKKDASKKITLERDKGPFGVGETQKLPKDDNATSSDEESESESEETEQSFRKAPSGLTLHLRLQRYARRHPGRLATRLLQRMERATRFEGAMIPTGVEGGKVRPCALSYYLAIMAPTLKDKWSVRTQRETRVLTEILDQLAINRAPTAADIIAQRLKALEQSAHDSNSWRRAKFLELVAEDMTLADRGEEQMMMKEAEQEEKFRGRHQGPHYNRWDEAPSNQKGKDGKGSGKNQKGKGKWKTPAQQATEKKDKRGSSSAPPEPSAPGVRQAEPEEEPNWESEKEETEEQAKRGQWQEALRVRLGQPLTIGPPVYGTGQLCLARPSTFSSAQGSQARPTCGTLSSWPPSNWPCWRNIFAQPLSKCWRVTQP